MNVNVATFRNDMADAINRVAYGGERVILERRGKPAAVLVSPEDLELLELLEDKEDVRAARRALAELKAGKAKTVPLEEVKKRLRL